MGRPDVVPFREEHLEDATRLLAARHARHRQSEPLLSERYEEPSVAREEIERILASAPVAASLAAARWVEEGRTRHSVLAPAHDAELLDAWWRLSFGQHAHGIR